MPSVKELLLYPNDERNVALVVENKNLWVSKEVLSMVSPVFKKMFYGEFKEGKQDRVELPGKKFEDIVELLECLLMYFGDQKPIDDQNVDVLARLADEYDISVIKIRCDTFLMRKIQNSSNYAELWTILDTSVKCRYNDLIKMCIARLATLPTEVITGRRCRILDAAIFAILEAKANRLDMTKHNISDDITTRCSSCRRKVGRCSKCRLVFCYHCYDATTDNPLICRAFHIAPCEGEKYKFPPTVECLCGYTFDDSWLSEL